MYTLLNRLMYYFQLLKNKPCVQFKVHVERAYRKESLQGVLYIAKNWPAKAQKRILLQKKTFVEEFFNSSGNRFGDKLIQFLINLLW